MSDYGQITATVRAKRGKGVARQLRMKGLCPAVMYGRGGENLSLTIDPHLLSKATDPQRHYNTLFHMTVEREGAAPEIVPCMIVDYQKDAIRDDLLHVDFLRVDVEEPVERQIPVRYHGRAAGVMKGGKLKTFRRHVMVRCKPAHIPVELAINIGPLDTGEYLRISDMSLPDVTFQEPPDAPLALVEMPKAVTETADEEEPAAAVAAKK
ncbi:MAG: 50S ribosomal protein L25 [Nannocystaceae bacterium]